MKEKNNECAEPRVWCGMIYVSDSRDVAGAVRSSKRLHWKQEAARQEVEGWVTQMGFDPVRWEIADDETLVGRIPGHFVVVSSLLLPKELVSLSAIGCAVVAPVLAG